MINEDIEMIPANNRDSLTDKFFKKEYAEHEIKMHERGFYHIAMEHRSFDRDSGERNSFSFVNIMSVAAYNMGKKNNGFIGYTMNIIHDPLMEEKGAKIVTLNYTLTDEEIALEEVKRAQLEESPNDAEDDEPIDETTIIMPKNESEVEGIADIKHAKAIYANLVGKEAGAKWNLAKVKSEISKLLVE